MTTIDCRKERCLFVAVRLFSVDPRQHQQLHDLRFSSSGGKVKRGAAALVLVIRAYSTLE